MKGYLLLALFVLNYAGAATTTLSNEDREQLNLTIYQQGFASIYEKRKVSLEKGENNLFIIDFSPTIAADSFAVFTDKVDVLEKRIQPGANTSVSLRLLSKAEKTNSIGFNYLAGEFDWRANYVLLIDDVSQKLSITSNAIVTNQTGIDYENITLQLITGQINTIDRFGYRPQPQMKSSQAKSYEVAAATYTPTSSSVNQDYYVYQFPRPVSIKDGQENRVLLFSKEGVSYQKKLSVSSNSQSTRFDQKGDEQKILVDSTLEVANTDENNLGIAFASGDVRVYQQNKGEPLYFVGADKVGSFAKNQNIEVNLGKTFDVRVTKIKTGFSKDEIKEKTETRIYVTETITKSTYQIQFSNGSDKDKVVEYSDHFSNNWKLIKQSQKADKETSSRAFWRVKVPANKSAKLTYTVEERS